MEEVNREVNNSSKEAEDCNSEVVDLKRQVQTLEIDLQAQLSLVNMHPPNMQHEAINISSLPYS